MTLAFVSARIGFVDVARRVVLARIELANVGAVESGESPFARAGVRVPRVRADAVLRADVVLGASIRRDASVSDSVLDGRFQPFVFLLADSHVLL